MSDILSVEIVFKAGPTMKLYCNDMYGFEIDSVPIAEIDYSKAWKKPKECKRVSFNIKGYENRKIWSFTHKATIDYFDWILYSGNIRDIKINLQNYQKRIFSVPWKNGHMDDNEYQSGEILANGDLRICIENPD